MRAGRTTEARADFEEALRLSPALAETHNNLGALLATDGRFLTNQGKGG